MGTVVAVETDGGVAVAGDSLATADGTVTSTHVDRVFDFEGVGAAATGDRADVDEFERELGAEVRSQRLETDGPVRIGRLAETAARVAETTRVEAVVAAPDDDGTARVRRVGATGAVTEGPVVAIGTGAALALGRLEGADLGVDLDGAAALVRDALEAAAERDAESGGETDVWTLANGDGDRESAE